MFSVLCFLWPYLLTSYINEINGKATAATPPLVNRILSEVGRTDFKSGMAIHIFGRITFQCSKKFGRTNFGRVATPLLMLDLWGLRSLVLAQYANLY